MATPRDLDYQARMHARSYERWFAPDEALRLAREVVERGDCWWWHEPQAAACDGQQMRLF